MKSEKRGKKKAAKEASEEKDKEDKEDGKLNPVAKEAKAKEKTKEFMPPELDAELEKAPKDAEEGGDEAKELGSAPPSLVQKSKPRPSADAEDDDEEPIEQNLTKDKARARKEK